MTQAPEWTAERSKTVRWFVWLGMVTSVLMTATVLLNLAVVGWSPLTRVSIGADLAVLAGTVLLAMVDQAEFRIVDGAILSAMLFMGRQTVPVTDIGTVETRGRPARTTVVVDKHGRGVALLNRLLFTRSAIAEAAERVSAVSGIAVDADAQRRLRLPRGRPTWGSLAVIAACYLATGVGLGLILTPLGR